MTKNDAIDILRGDLAHLRSEFGVDRIGVFGSFAKGSQTDASDVDVLVEFRRPLGLRFVEFSEHLERLLGRKTDVLTPVGIRAIRNPEIASSIEESVVYV